MHQPPSPTAIIALSPMSSKEGEKRNVPGLTARAGQCKYGAQSAKLKQLQK